MSFKEKIMYGKFLFGIFLHGYPLNLTVTMFTKGNIVGGLNIPHPLCPHLRAHNEMSISQSRCAWEARRSKGEMPPGFFPEQNEKYTSAHNEMFTITIS